MATFKESAVYLALTAESKDKEAILSALGSATTDFNLRSETGQTYVHLAASCLIGVDLPDVWSVLLAKANIFLRDINGNSGLDYMIDHLPVAWANNYLKAYLKSIDSSDVEKFAQLLSYAGMSGKTLHLKRLATAANADKAIAEHLEKGARADEEILEIQKAVKCDIDSAELLKLVETTTLTDVNEEYLPKLRTQRLGLPDLVGLPSLHIAIIHGQWSTVAMLVEKFPDIVNIRDHMGRTALHYAVSMKGDGAEATVKLLTDAKADADIKDMNGADVAALKANPLDMEEFVKNYTTNFERQLSSEMMFRLHEAVISGDLRSVKMALTRRELAFKQDASRLTPLHKAVILKKTDIATWIATQFKGSMDIQGTSGLTPMHFAAVVDKELYESLKQAGGDSHTVDVEGNDPEYYKDHSSDFILNIDTLKEELLVTPPTRPVTAASERAKSAAKPSSAGKSATPAISQPVRAPPVMANARQAPAPETLDAKYIAEVLGNPLTAALAEVAEKRPWDPIEYLAQWLYKHKANLNYHQQQIDAVKEAEAEEQRKKDEAENRARRRREAIALKEMEEERKRKAEDEARKLKEQEELQKKAKESMNLAQPPELPTVAEDEETAAEAVVAPVSPRDVVEKDEQGKTQLHTLVSSGGSVEDVSALLTTSGVSLLGERDLNGNTARDLAESDEMRQCLDNYVVELLKAGDTKSMAKLLENGYMPPEGLTQDVELPDASHEVLKQFTELPNVLSAISKAVRSGDVSALKQCVDKPSLAVCKLNSHGACALHLAVLYERVEAAQHLLTAFPGIAHCRDQQNRTALHYAYSLANEQVRDSLANLLTEGQADVEAEDCQGRKPQAYTELTDEVGAMKEPVADEPAAEPTATEAAPAAGEQPAADGAEPPAGEGAEPPAGEGAEPPAGDAAPPADGTEPATEEAAPAADETPAAE